MTSLDRRFIAYVVALLAVACLFMPVPTPTPEPTATLVPTPTPRFVALPPPGVLADMVAEEAGGGFRYLPWHYVAEGSVVWLVFGWPEEDDRIYRAIFGTVGGEWVLLAVEPTGEEQR